MKYLLSMDGGGSKNAWLLTDENGCVVASFTTAGGSRPQLDTETVIEQIRHGVQNLLHIANIQKSDLLAAVFGVPCYTEYPESDKQILSALQSFLSPVPVSVYNDVELGFAGSLALETGIHIVAGTGVIAIGRNSAGQSARSNGWSPYFSDEGSGYWLGMQTLALFAKQSDGRTPRGALYDIVRTHFSLENDMDISDLYDKTLAPDRKKVASVQLLLQKAAEAGDPSAIELYTRAAEELIVSIRAIYDILNFAQEGKTRISYSGGLFHEGSFILPIITRLVESICAEITKPRFTPVWGGILLAMQSVCSERAHLLCDQLMNSLET